MVKCAYCSSDLKKGTGIMYVYRSGDISYYCSSGCLRNNIVMRKKINRKLIKGTKPTKKPAVQEVKK